MIERELRYLVHRSVVPGLPPGDDIAQGYLVATEELTIRLRRRGPHWNPGAGSASEAVKWSLTVKTLLPAFGPASVELPADAPPQGSERREVEIPLDVDQARELWEMSGERVITKTRHLVGIDSGLIAEVDVLTGRWEGLVMVEVEFSSREHMQGFVPPVWFGREVTSDPRFTNAGLAMCGALQEAELRRVIQAECGTGA